MATSAVRFSLPSPSLFKFPPASIPSAVPPPTSEFTYAPRFEIPPKLYNHLLSAAYPITFAVLYGSLVPYLNRINRERGNKPWAFSKTWIFFMAVVAHNIFLAAYSGWTFTGILDAFRHAWPGLQGENGLAGAVDALCKIHGPRGLGSGVAFNSTTNIWTAPNVAINLTPLGLPDNTDLGRLWNEGVAYYGWLFYLSKFYEILDTAIVLAKGKTVSPLQAYHHAGALIGVWAGIRYMSPPISMFILVNSGIHAVMYTYYALTSLSIPIFRSIKRLITTLQISQFIFGTLYALAHLFISYSVPVSIPYTVAPSISSAVSAASSAASLAVTSVATAASSAGIGNILKKVALRAAGEEGLAANVPLANDKAIFRGDSLLHKMKDIAKEDIQHRTENQMMPCIDTSGQSFAIWLNVLYLAPLTYLFVRFFARAYNKRTSPDTPHPTHSSVLGKAGRDAVKGVQRELDDQPVPLKEQTEEVGKAAKSAAERVVMELGKEAVADEDEDQSNQPASRKKAQEEGNMNVESENREGKAGKSNNKGQTDGNEDKDDKSEKTSPTKKTATKSDAQPADRNTVNGETPKDKQDRPRQEYQTEGTASKGKPRNPEQSDASKDGAPAGKPKKQVKQGANGEPAGEKPKGLEQNKIPEGRTGTDKPSPVQREDTPKGPQGGVDGSKVGNYNRQGPMQKPDQGKDDNKQVQEEQKKKQEQADHNQVRALIVADSEEDKQLVVVGDPTKPGGS